MNKNMIIGLILIILLLTGCSGQNFTISSKISEPSIAKPPIYGIWTDRHNEDNFFYANEIIFKNTYNNNISYKTKKLNMESYLLYKYRLDQKMIDINNRRASFISIYSDGQFLYELLKIDDDNILLFKDNEPYFLKRKSDEISEKDFQSYFQGLLIEEPRRETKDKGKDKITSGLMLGLKRKEEDKIIYENLYIKLDKDNKYDIYRANENNLLVPRKTGFYRLKIENLNGIDHLYLKKENDLQVKQGLESESLKEILYLGNDYISLEIEEADRNKYLRLYPLDYLGQSDGVLLSEILDTKTISELSNVDGITEELGRSFDLLNFGLKRRNGYWTLINRVENSSKGYKDYSLPILTPGNIVKYDKLSIPWSYMKSKLGNIKDGITSPNEEFVVIQVGNSLKAYKITGNKIIDEEIFSYRLKKNETIIMNEWGTGIYADLWENMFIN